MTSEDWRLMNIVVRYEDPWLLVVEKPHGLAAQATKRDEPDLFGVLGADRPYLGLHHRLDQPASGLVMFTLDPMVNAPIAEAFKEHRIARTYLAVLQGEATAAVWTRPIDRQPARTLVRVLGQGEGMSAVQIGLQTGRQHQIRQHAAMAGRPIIGDRRYGGDAGRRWPRLALHAAKLGFVHPIDGKTIVVESPIPPDLAELWTRAGGTSPLPEPPSRDGF